MKTWQRTFILFLYVTLQCIGIADWDLPVFPLQPPTSFGNVKQEKMIPRHLWMAVRDLNYTLPFYTKALFERNKNWEIHVCSNDMKDRFMNETFANTSFLWAYNIISPAAGAAKADLWRYAVLWTYGGVYIDDDSDMKRPLDEMIEPKDTFITSYEKNGFNGNRCYIPNYKLSDFVAYRDESKRDLHIFTDHVLLNWAIVSAARHPMIAQTMINAVDILKHEHAQDSVLRSLAYAHRWSAIMCATGPSLMTASAREVILHENDSADGMISSTDTTLRGARFTYKLLSTDFKDFGGRFKAVAMPVKNDPAHYMNLMKGSKALSLLRDYQPETPVTSQQLKDWQVLI
jgi:hypothetical protein